MTKHVFEILEHIDTMRLCDIKEFLASKSEDRSILECERAALASRLAAVIVIAAKAGDDDRHASALFILATMTASVTAVL